MEFLAAIVVLVLVNAGFKLLMRGLSGGAKAVSRTVRGQGTLSENLGNELKGMGRFEIRAVQRRVGDEGAQFDIVVVEGKGLIPNEEPANLVGVLSLMARDREGEWAPVLCSLDNYQEPRTVVFMSSQEHDDVPAGVGYSDWAGLGVLGIVPTLTPPVSGKQSVQCVFWWLDSSVDSEIYAGLPLDRRAILGRYTTTIELDLSDGQGYVESIENRNQMKGLAVQMAVAVAMSDSEFHESEGQFIKQWIEKQLAVLSGEQLADVKRICNEGLRSAYTGAANGTLSMSTIVSQINDLADKNEKFEVIELCMDVMAADGTAQEEEMSLIWKVARAMSLDRAEVERLKDKKVLRLNVASHAESASAESLLGIEPSWSVAEKKQFLMKEFAKWNSRIHSIADPAEKEKAQHMLDLIAQARKALA